MRSLLLLTLTGCLWTKSDAGRVDTDTDADTDSGESETGEDCQERTWYVDADGDSYGEASYEVVACAQPEGMSSTATDCDDTDESVFPGAIEVCDGKDDDCDGLTDEEDPGLDTTTETWWFRDADGDGHGDARDAGTLVCDDPSTAFGTYVQTDDDCDDSSAEVAPGNSEICGNGQDDDCDGAAGDCGLSGELGLEDADATVYGDEFEAGLGEAAGWGDLDGDGTPDLLIHSVGRDEGVTRVDLISGPLRGTVARTAGSASVNAVDEAAFGDALVADADLDGDGWDDLLVSDPDADDAGSIYLFTGPLRGDLTLVLAQGSVTGEDGDDAGQALTVSLGLDGSASPTVIAGLPGASDAAGAVALLDPPTDGATTLDAARALLVSDVDAAEAGRGLASADLDGDGLDELIIGAPQAGDAAGRVWLWSGPASGALSLADAASALDGTEAGQELGAAVAAAGDVNGDGYLDALLGTPESGTDEGGGGAILLAGGATLPTSLDEAAAWLTGPAYGLAGRSVAGAGDLSGDGYDDVVVGAPLLDDAGAAWVALGPLSGSVALEDSVLKIAGSTGSLTGSSLLVGADLTGDGAPDIGVGAPGDDRFADDAGAFSLYSWPGL